ncbi:MAG: ASKHA domain-containing protein [Treponema sp.]|jgi:uncharacterized 2Fe-2S/4Fe-4S cluster protein (DUF4445 family)|nr:ASKHA domain-containing protein [Treponema sp.]
MNITVRGVDRVCTAGPGETVLSALARGGVAISAPCGGRGFCGKCKVRLVAGSISGVTPDPAGYPAGLFSACRAFPLSDITIALVQDETLAENPPPGVKNLPGAVVALDIGTTTLSARLLDPDTGEAAETLSQLNDQRVFGADVMSRIGAARSGKTGELFSLINRQTFRVLEDFKNRYNIKKIERLMVSGNTTMLHLFANTDPSGMGELPFTPVFLEKREYAGAEFDLPAERITLLPSISAFIGGDIVAGLAALDILNIPGPSLFIDIGTNGEMALSQGGELFCCSTAAGPAFEGAEISCGMGSVKGAVNKVEDAGGGIRFTTIGGAPPRGICGCGLIDAVALMLKRGIIDETGAFCGEEDFCIAPGVTINQRDIRQFQLAKSAILSGVRILCKNAALKPEGPVNVFIAGGFGFYIDKKNAVKAGLLPGEFLDRIYVCGNLSLQGAAAALTDAAFLETCGGIIQHSRVTELAADPAFTEEFAENMLFEVPDPEEEN